MAAQMKQSFLEEFSTLADHAQTPILVGYDAIMNKIMRRADGLARHDSQTSATKTPSRGKMQLIHGSLGIGKTALLDRLAMQRDPLAAREDNGGYIHSF